MEYYAGLVVSLKEISVCVVDRDGNPLERGTCPADPEGVAGWLRNRGLKPHRIVHESGTLSIWLQRGMARLGLPAICIDARKAHKSLSARLNKSDAADAEGLARARSYRLVHARAHSRRPEDLPYPHDLHDLHGPGPVATVISRSAGRGRRDRYSSSRHRRWLHRCPCHAVPGGGRPGQNREEKGQGLPCSASLDDDVRCWAVRLAGRRGFRNAAVATARKTAVVMLTLWKNETDYKWTTEATARSEFPPEGGERSPNGTEVDRSRKTVGTQARLLTPQTT